MRDVLAAELLLRPAVPHGSMRASVKYVYGQGAFAVLAHIEGVAPVRITPPAASAPAPTHANVRIGICIDIGPFLGADRKVNSKISGSWIGRQLISLARQFRLDRIFSALDDQRIIHALRGMMLAGHQRESMVVGKAGVAIGIAAHLHCCAPGRSEENRSP